MPSVCPHLLGLFWVGAKSSRRQGKASAMAFKPNIISICVPTGVPSPVSSVSIPIDACFESHRYRISAWLGPMWSYREAARLGRHPMQLPKRKRYIFVGTPSSPSA